MPSSPAILAVVGPTASGKTALSLRLAAALNGEIVSCDSMQIYRGMDIGTAKPTPAERAGIPHHLIDIVSPAEPFSCAAYKALAEAAVSDILARGRVPIFCGGTGLYLDAILQIDAFSPDVPTSVKEALDVGSDEELWEKLRAVDPESASAIHPNNRKRVLRALSIPEATGRTKTEWDRLSRSAAPRYRPFVIGLDYRDRQRLYRRIDDRVDAMLANGLVDEVKALALDPASTAGQAIGYKEIALWLNGGVSYEEAVALLKRNTRRYAKRQLTWFGRWDDCLRILWKEIPDFEKALRISTDYLTARGYTPVP